MTFDSFQESTWNDQTWCENINCSFLIHLRKEIDHLVSLPQWSIRSVSVTAKAYYRGYRRLSLFARRPEAPVAHRPRPQMRRLRSDGDGDDPRMWVALSPLRGTAPATATSRIVEMVPRGKFRVATSDRARQTIRSDILAAASLSLSLSSLIEPTTLNRIESI